MKRFSLTILLVFALFHFIGTLLLVAQLNSAGWAIERGERSHLPVWLGLT
jgi:hypothetical protein